MPAKILTVADAVVTLFNAQTMGAGSGHTFGVVFEASRVPVRIVALEELAAVDVAVVTGEGSCSSTSPADGVTERDLEFNIEVRQRVDDVTDNTVVDPLIDLLEQMTDLLLSQPGSELDGNAYCKSASYAYLVTELEQSSLFVGVLTVSFGVCQ